MKMCGRQEWSVGIDSVACCEFLVSGWSARHKNVVYGEFVENLHLSEKESPTTSGYLIGQKD